MLICDRLPLPKTGSDAQMGAANGHFFSDAHNSASHGTCCKWWLASQMEEKPYWPTPRVWEGTTFSPPWQSACPHALRKEESLIARSGEGTHEGYRKNKVDHAKCKC